MVILTQEGRSKSRGCLPSFSGPATARKFGNGLSNPRGALVCFYVNRYFPFNSKNYWRANTNYVELRTETTWKIPTVHVDNEAIVSYGKQSKTRQATLSYTQITSVSGTHRSMMENGGKGALKRRQDEEFVVGRIFCDSRSEPGAQNVRNVPKRRM